jgi:putative ABC transport system permease protein
MLPRLHARFSTLWQRRRKDADLSEEIQFHLSEEAAEQEAAGLAPVQARLAARRDFGSATLVREAVREAWGWSLADQARQDVAYALRSIRRAPGFALTAVLTLGLGIGGTTTVFTFVNAILLRSLPFDQPDRIVSLATEDARGGALGVSRLDYYDWRDQARSFSGLAMFQGAGTNVSGDGRDAERLTGTYGTANLFALLGVRPLLGRDFRPGDDQPRANPVVILSYGLWTHRYGRDPTIVGHTIRVNTLLDTVIGVMPPDMGFPNNNDLWMLESTLPGVNRAGTRDVRNFSVFGRLAPGVTLAQAQTDMDRIGARLARDFPATNEHIRPTIVPYRDRVTAAQLRLMLYALMGAVACVWLIACANVANLLLARATRRSREMAIRLSLGAGRGRVVRQILVESLLLAMVSGLLGLGLSILGVRIFDGVLTTAVTKPYWMTFTVDGRVFAFFAVVCAATGLLFGVAPAWQISKPNVHEVLKDGASRSGPGGVDTRRWTSALITTEVALTLVLLAGAGFMMRSFLVLYRMDLGIDPSPFLTMRMYLPLTKYPQPEPRAVLYRHLEEQLGGVSAIQASALATNPPLAGGFPRDVAVAGRPVSEHGTAPEVTMVGISANYLDTLGVRLTRGRGLTEADGTPGHVGAIVNQRFVDLHFPTEDPLGRLITLTDRTLVAGRSSPTVATIVGIVPNMRQRDVRGPAPDPVVYLPYQADPPRGMVLIVRAPGDAGRVTALVRDAMHAVEPDVPLFGIQTLDDMLAQSRWSFRIFGAMFALFAAIALVLSAVGLYGVTAYAVTQRTPEIGVRMALGAQPRQVLWLVLRRALAPLAVALPVGGAGAVGVGTLLRSLLMPASGRDPILIASIAAGLLVAMALAASLGPARRAMRIDPMGALRDRTGPGCPPTHAPRVTHGETRKRRRRRSATVEV